MRKTSLTTRAFLFSFVPVCVVLAATFVALNALVEQRVKQGLRDSLEKSEELLARANLESSRRIGQFVAVLAESAGLKAAIGLVREAPAPGNAAEVRRTIEAQLRELHALVGYDLLAVTDWKGRTMAAVEFRDGEVRAAAQLPEIAAAPVLMETGGVLYELTTTPIAIGGEQIGDLRLGSKFVAGFSGERGGSGRSMGAGTLECQRRMATVSIRFAKIRAIALSDGSLRRGQERSDAAGLSGRQGGMVEIWPCSGQEGSLG
jgi:hypothetical protein